MFVLYLDHKVLKFINYQHKLNKRHATWVEFLQAYNVSIKYKASMQNVVADALSRKHALLSSIKVKVIGFEAFKELYENEVDFGRIWESCKQGSFNQFSIFDVFFFKNNALYLSYCSLGGHFGRDKTLALIQSNFYWPKMMMDVDRHVKQGHVCHLARQ